ncbi:MAG: GNAT family N-acetyltransferase [Nanoarchaeota archaeon]|nr:GNAT family N-acetyltransferase [Nanoarchaeota archaeon]
MEIRKVNNNDLEQLTQLIIEFKEGLTDFEPEDLKVFRRKIKSSDLIKKSVKEEIDNPNGLFLVAEDENKLVGFIFGTIRENTHMVYDTVKFGMLNHIWITNNYRGRGLASKFKDNLFQWFKDNNCKYIKLLVLDANPTKHIYEKWGFEIVLDSMVKVI